MCPWNDSGRTANPGNAWNFGSSQMTDNSSSDRGVPLVTQSDIALEAGVSATTVSKVLNARPDVSEKTRRRVEALLREHGYLLDSRARRRGTKAIELHYYNNLKSQSSIEIIPSVERVAREAGFSLVVTESASRHGLGQTWVDGVVQRRPAGVLLAFSELKAVETQRLWSRGIGVVVIDPTGEATPDLPSIGSTNWAGGFAAAQHLLDLGHRRIGMITGPADMLCSVQRVDGYRAALERHGLPFDEELLYYGNFQVEGGVDGGRRLLTLPHPPTAIFAGSDLHALGVYQVAHALGRQIPDDLSVVGYDDVQVARWAGPPLTTVRQPLDEMAAAATRLLLDVIEHPDTRRDYRVELATSLIVRGSTAAPRRHADQGTADVMSA